MLQIQVVGIAVLVEGLRYVALRTVEVTLESELGTGLSLSRPSPQHVGPAEVDVRNNWTSSRKRPQREITVKTGGLRTVIDVALNRPGVSINLPIESEARPPHVPVVDPRVPRER